MSYLLIDSLTGTILDPADCYLVPCDSLDDNDNEALDGSDSDIASVAQSKGTNLLALGHFMHGNN
jgi:hypothetical protein